MNFGNQSLKFLFSFFLIQIFIDIKYFIWDYFLGAHSKKLTLSLQQKEMKDNGDNKKINSISKTD